MKNGKNFIIFLLLIAVLVLGYLRCEGTDTPDKPTNEAPQQIISVEQANEMYDTYTERRIGLIQQYERPNPDGSPFNPTRYGWYDYKTIKQYLAYVEHEAKMANVEVSGIQFYLTSYPDKQTFSNGVPVKYPRQNSFMLIPTMNVDGNDIGFMTDGAGDKRKAIPLSNVIGQLAPNQQKGGQTTQQSAGFGSKFLMMNPNFMNSLDHHEGHSLILNEGSLIPPPRQSTDFDL